MYFVYTVALVILLIILLLLRKEEDLLKNNITQGLVNKYWILRERRKYVRFNDEIKVRYNVLNKPNFQYTKATNISRKGICIITYEKLKEKGYLELDLELPGISKPIKVIGQIVWIKELQTPDTEGRRLFYTGIKFIKIKRDSDALLVKHLNTLKPEVFQGIDES